MTLFVEKLLRLGLNFSRDNIFYSSDYATDIKTGDDIPDALKSALFKMTLFILFVSRGYKKSEICMNEMGAAWLKLPKEYIVTFVLPPLSFGDIGFINVQRKAIRLDDFDNMFKIFDDYKEVFRMNNPQAGEFHKKLREFLEEAGFILK